jgi:hypothetical protein
MGHLDGVWNFLSELIFWRNFWRRGTHVNTPKNGSRGDKKCLGEFWGVYAELRRESVWGNLKIDFFEFLLVVPRRDTEEGGHSCVFFGFSCQLVGFNWVRGC